MNMRTRTQPIMRVVKLKLNHIIKILIYLTIHIVFRNLTGWAAFHPPQMATERPEQLL